MARQFKPPPPKQPAQLTSQQMAAGIKLLTKRLDDVKAFDPQSVTDQFSTPGLDALTTSIDEALVRTFGAESWDYERYRSAKNFDCGPYNYANEVQPHEFQASIARSKDSSIAVLGSAIKALTERLEEHSSIGSLDQRSVETTRLPSRKVFVVHGHAGAEEAVALFLSRLDFEPIILHLQPNQGRTIIEKFESHSDVGFAVVLLTPDDVGGSIGGEQKPRARQNVILELGYFIGRLTRARVCAFKKGDVEIPSDILGVAWEEFDAHGAWQLKLATELRAAKYDVDLNKL